MADLDITQKLQLLFDRPGETLLTPKGADNALFVVNKMFLPKEFEKYGLAINKRFEDKSKKIFLKELDEPPSCTKACQLPKDVEFSVFVPRHQEMAAEVIKVLMGIPENELETFLSTSVYYRENLNPQLFNYCFSVALAHRKDTRNIPTNNIAETFPAKFLDSRIFALARKTSALVGKGIPSTPIIIPVDFTGSDLDVEHRLAYFREDLGVNLHHWHWHLVYPITADDTSIVAKDRRGELFYYMHQQIIARYNGDRLNNYLRRVKKFSYWKEAIPQAYFPKLDSLTASRGRAPRQANMHWNDLNRPVDDLYVRISDMERHRRNLEDAIAIGVYRKSDGTTHPLDIDTLGNMIEATILSPNRELYGNLHNNGHNFFGYIHDPRHLYLEDISIMGDVAIAMRDPVFYCWHAFVDDLFQRFKEMRHVVPPYGISELENPGVEVTSATIESDTGENNVLNTFWMLSDIDMQRGLDFSDRGPVYVRFTHLNHRDFRYVINVNNTGAATRATVRIFIAPKYDERNLPWMLSEQRKLFIEMDRFVTPLNAGPNTITRKSSESTVTIPFEQTFRNLRAAPGNTTEEMSSYCGCGWPQHMLVPKGRVSGAEYQLFVMLSNYEMDKVDQPDGGKKTCKEASSFCGLKDKKYPDRRAMGFPFDRPSSSAANIQEFILPNMALTDITIRLQDTDPEPNPRNAI